MDDAPDNDPQVEEEDDPYAKIGLPKNKPAEILLGDQKEDWAQRQKEMLKNPPKMEFNEYDGYWEFCPGSDHDEEDIDTPGIQKRILPGEDFRSGTTDELTPEIKIKDGKFPKEYGDHKL